MPESRSKCKKDQCRWLFKRESRVNGYDYDGLSTSKIDNNIKKNFHFGPKFLLFKIASLSTNYPKCVNFKRF